MLAQKAPETSGPPCRTGTMARGSATPGIGSGCKVGGSGKGGFAGFCRFLVGGQGFVFGSRPATRGET